MKINTASESFKCPECGSDNYDRVGDMMRCRQCEKYSHIDNVPATEPIAEPVPPPDIQATPVMVYYLPEVRIRREKIKRNANLLAIIGAFFAVIGFIAGLFGIIALKSDDNPSSGFYCFAVCVSIGLWFYLIAQVAHIRANTEN